MLKLKLKLMLKLIFTISLLNFTIDLNIMIIQNHVLKLKLKLMLKLFFGETPPENPAGC